MQLNFKEGLEAFSRLPSGSVLERLGALETDFRHAEGKGLFVPLPHADPHRSRDISRIRTIRNRLANLGYPVEDSGRAVLNEELREAIRCFQHEAGLTVDGWVGGEETWPALQELASFETPINISRWLEDGKPNAALRHAVTLRLFVLGLWEKKPTSPDHDVSEGFLALGRIWEILKLGEAINPAAYNPEWIERLFDQDGLVARLAAAPVSASTRDMINTHGFLLNVAKIELWLSGYRVCPAGYDMKSFEGPTPTNGDSDGFDIWKKSSSITKFFRIKRNLSFYRALNRFWQDQGESAKNVDHMSLDFLEVFPRFFKAVDNGLTADAHMTMAERQALIEATIERYPKQIPTLWSYVRTLGNRIWDGMRRAWGWLKNFLRKTSKKCITIGRNISRLIYHYAMGAYTILSNILEGFGESVRLITEPYLEISDADTGIISHDGDFDFKLTLNMRADPAAIKNLARNLRRQTRLFGFICKILGIFIRILTTVIKNMYAGYVGLILALVKFRREWDRIPALISEYESLFETRLTRRNRHVQDHPGNLGRALWTGSG